MEEKTKFCKYCGEKIFEDAILCPKCGRQVEELRKSNNEPIIINNNVASSSSSSAAMSGMVMGVPKNKWVALVLCTFLGLFGGHKFYEGKVGMGILYFFTCGLFFIGVFVDFITILCKPTIYYVY